MIKIIKGSDKDISVKLTNDVTQDPYDFSGVDLIEACFTKTDQTSLDVYYLALIANINSTDIISAIDTTNISEGDPVYGPGIPTGAVVLKTPLSTSSPTLANTIKISIPATATTVGVALTVGQITILNAILGKIKISLDEADTDSLDSGEDRSFEIRVVKAGRTSYVQFLDSLNIVERLC
jgi:hypothetical protein